MIKEYKVEWMQDGTLHRTKNLKTKEEAKAFADKLGSYASNIKIKTWKSNRGC